MEENKRKEIEEKLRKMLLSDDKAQQESQQTWNGLCGASVIRRRKGSPDVAIV
jgi:hypothetical protein